MFWAAEHYKNTVSLLIIGGCWIIYVDEYRSGHNEAVLKTVGPKGHGGSNPSSSAKYGSRGGNGIHARLWL